MDTRTELSQRAWKLREDGKPIQAIAIWQSLYYGYAEEKDWDKVIDVLLDIAISWKIISEIKNKKDYAETALKTLHHIKYIADTEDVLLRSDYAYHLAGIQTAAGEYVTAIESYEHYFAHEQTQEEEANVKAHVGFARAKIGEKTEGIQMLREAIDVFEKSEHAHDNMQSDTYCIWKLGAKLRLAQLFENKEEAKELVEDVLKEAKEKNLGARRKQAETLLKTFE
jgi:hypothetical protein